MKRSVFLCTILCLLLFFRKSYGQIPADDQTYQQYEQPFNSLEENKKEPFFGNKRTAIIYKDEQPIGIIQPNERSFELLPINGDKFFVELAYDDKEVFKRNTEHIENELKEIVDEMGLTSNEIIKRDLENMDKEDENLENGANNIKVKAKRNESKKTRSAKISSSLLNQTPLPLPSEYASHKILDMQREAEEKIHNKIASLKEEVKREIEELKMSSLSRKKRQTKNLLDSETIDLNPVFNIEEKLEPHIRRRRSILKKQYPNSTNVGVKIQNTIPNKRSNHKIRYNRKKLNFKSRTLKGIEDFNNDDGDEAVVEDLNRTKRKDFIPALVEESRDKRFIKNDYFIDFNPEFYKLVKFDPKEGLRPVHRQRRRINRNVMEKQPNKLVDMTEEDLFGALPQSYEGELARYKRVKREGY